MSIQHKIHSLHFLTKVFILYFSLLTLSLPDYDTIYEVFMCCTLLIVVHINTASYTALIYPILSLRMDTFKYCYCTAFNCMSCATFLIPV